MEKIDDIVSMIDRFMAGEGGHLNISVQKDSPNADREIKTAPSLDCSTSQMACQAPTLHEGLDTDTEEE